MPKEHTFEGIVHRMTPKAVQFEGYYWEGSLWFPTSQITLIEDEESHILRVNDWLIRKRDLHEFTFYGAEQIEKMNER